MVYLVGVGKYSIHGVNMGMVNIGFVNVFFCCPTCCPMRFSLTTTCLSLSNECLNAVMCLFKVFNAPKSEQLESIFLLGFPKVSENCGIKLSSPRGYTTSDHIVCIVFGVWVFGFYDIR